MRKVKYDKNQISQVTYGLDSKIIDITNIFLKSDIYSNVNRNIDELIGGDPFPGVYKNLTIKWKDNDLTTIKHGDTIVGKKSNTVIYFTPTGSQYREMCMYAVQSILNSNKYDGDIIVFCDEIDDYIKEIENFCIVIMIKFDCFPLVNRIYALDYINSKYDSILYLDCDVLIYNDINKLFCYDSAVKYMEEPWQYNKNTKSGVIDTYYFTKDERNVLFGDLHPINSGHFSISGTYKDTFYKVYKSQYETRKNFAWGQDQASLNYIIRKEMVNAIAYENNIIGIATHTSRDDFKKFDLIHFAGHNNRVKLIRELLGSIKYGE